MAAGALAVGVAKAWLTDSNVPQQDGLFSLFALNHTWQELHACVANCTPAGAARAAEQISNPAETGRKVAALLNLVSDMSTSNFTGSTSMFILITIGVLIVLAAFGMSQVWLDSDDEEWDRGSSRRYQASPVRGGTSPLSVQSVLPSMPGKTSSFQGAQGFSSSAPMQKPPMMSRPMASMQQQATPLLASGPLGASSAAVPQQQQTPDMPPRSPPGPFQPAPAARDTSSTSPVPSPRLQAQKAPPQDVTFSNVSSPPGSALLPTRPASMGAPGAGTALEHYAVPRPLAVQSSGSASVDLELRGDEVLRPFVQEGIWQVMKKGDARDVILRCFVSEARQQGGILLEVAESKNKIAFLDTFNHCFSPNFQQMVNAAKARGEQPPKRKVIIRKPDGDGAPAQPAAVAVQEQHGGAISRTSLRQVLADGSEGRVLHTVMQPSPRDAKVFDEKGEVVVTMNPLVGDPLASIIQVSWGAPDLDFGLVFCALLASCKLTEPR